MLRDGSQGVLWSIYSATTARPNWLSPPCTGGFRCGHPTLPGEGFKKARKTPPSRHPECPEWH